MNALDLIKDDHQEMMALLEQIERTSVSGDNDDKTRSRKELLQEVKRTLQLHESMEENYFYPALVSLERNLIKEAYLEHDLVDQLLDDLENEAVLDEDWMAKFSVFRELIQHHVDEEENEIFKKAEDIFDTKKLDELGRKMEDYRRQITH